MDHVLQGMAGNIIHAIATTNAIIAGFVVIEAIKVLAGAQDQCKVSVRLTCAPSIYGVSAVIVIIDVVVAHA